MAAFIPGSVTAAVGGRRRPALCTSRGTTAGRTRVETRCLVVDVGSAEQLQVVLESAKEADALVVIDYSTTWCGPCKVVSPKFEALSDEHPSVVFCKVMGDADADSSTLMKREGIRAVPAFHFWKAGKRVDEVTGAKIDDVVATMKEHIARANRSPSRRAPQVFFRERPGQPTERWDVTAAGSSSPKCPPAACLLTITNQLAAGELIAEPHQGPNCHV
nr:PhM00028.1 [Neoporphyra haitanensis]WOE55263.1 PhF00030.1 [Neoporphyra haitanensis]